MAISQSSTSTSATWSANGVTVLSTDATGEVSARVNGSLRALTSITPNIGSSTAPVYACRAWVNFNGTGTVAIRASGNVSSITDNGVGDYTVNFTTAMEDANYVALGTVRQATATERQTISGHNATTPTSSLWRLISTNNAGTGTDIPDISVAIFR